MSHDKANQSEVGEGPKAVDAALRRFVREAEALETETPKTETPEAEATSGIESVEALLGDLELGADEATSTVVETIGELDDAAEDAAKTLELAIAEITKLGETDPKAADAALQRIAHAREAREAEALEADAPEAEAPRAEAPEAETPEAEATSDIESVEALLRDLELGADESSSAVVETIGELDAAAESNVEAAIAKAESYEAQDVLAEARREPNKLREQMRAARTKINGGVRVAPADPLATDKIRITRYLKKFGLTLDDLPNCFWDEPDEAARGSLLGKTVGPVMAERCFAKRVKRSIDRGYPTDYYSRPSDEQRQISSVVRKRRWRAEQAIKPAPTPKAPLPTTMITKEWIRDSFTRLKSWTAGSDPMAIQLRSRERDFVKVRAAYQRLINTLGRAPKQSELAAELGCTRRVAQNRIDRLHKLEGVGGPWHEKR
jgi:hypothetical protein